MLENLDLARRKLLAKFPGEFGFVRGWQLTPWHTHKTGRTTCNELHLAKILPDGTIVAVALFKHGKGVRSPGTNGKPASYFNVLRNPNARANHRNGIVTYGFIQVIP